jgi:chromosome segregation ATPase
MKISNELIETRNKLNSKTSEYNTMKADKSVETEVKKISNKLNIHKEDQREKQTREKKLVHQKENQSNNLSKLKEKQGALDNQKNTVIGKLDSLKEKSKEIDKSIDENKYELKKKNKESEHLKSQMSALANEHTDTSITLKIKIV